MGISSEPFKDAYVGIKKEFSRSPWTVASVVCLWVIAWAIYLFIYPELARAGELSSVKTDVNQLIIRSLDREILATRTQQCKATSKTFFTSRLQDLIREYQEKTKILYLLPSCEDLN